MNASQDCQRARIYIGEADRFDGKPLYEALVFKARELGLSGATVFRSPMGFGANSVVHSAKLLNLSSDLPIVLEIIDEEPKIQLFLQQIETMLDSGLVTLEPIKVVHYRHRAT